MNREITVITGEDCAGMRIDMFLTETDEADILSRSAAQRLIQDGFVLVGGKPVKSNYRLRVGDKLTITVPEPVETAVVPEDIPLDILYEDSDVIVINKPQGMVVHPAPGHYTGTVVNALLYHCQGSLSGIGGELRPGIVHRIDKDTSGVIVSAKNDFAHMSLSKQLEEHSMKRVYHALVLGNVKDDSGTIDKNIARHPQDRKRMCIVSEGGRRAVTHFEVIDRLKQVTHITARLETGRTHQIRVHMSSLHHPVLGDLIYGPERQPHKCPGQALHAAILGFVHPASKEYMEFSAKLPDYFSELLKKI